MSPSPPLPSLGNSRNLDLSQLYHAFTIFFPRQLNYISSYPSDPSYILPSVNSYRGIFSRPVFINLLIYLSINLTLCLSIYLFVCNYQSIYRHIVKSGMSVCIYACSAQMYVQDVNDANNNVNNA